MLLHSLKNKLAFYLKTRYFVASFFIYMQTNLSSQIAKGILKAIAVLLGAWLLLWFLSKISTLFLYFTIALILSLISMPLVLWLERKLKFKRFLAVISVITIHIGAFVGFIMLFIPLLVAQSKKLSLLNNYAIEQKVQFIYEDFKNWASANQWNVDKLISEIDITQYLDYSLIPESINYAFGTIGSFFIGALSVLFITFFLLKDQHLFSFVFQKILPTRQKEGILNSLEKVSYLLSRYLLGLLLQLIIIFSLDFLVLSIFGVDNALVIAFLCALLNVIPYIGPLMGTTLAATLTLISKIGTDFATDMLPTTLYVVIGYILVQLVDNFMNQPLIFSKSVKSHPLEIFFVILIFGYLFGIVGMIIAVPVYTILKVFAKEFFPENMVVKILTRKI